MGMWGGILEGMNQNAAEVISDQQVQMALDREERAIETHKLDNKIKQVSLLNTVKDLTGRDGELTFIERLTRSFEDLNNINRNS